MNLRCSFSGDSTRAYCLQGRRLVFSDEDTFPFEDLSNRWCRKEYRSQRLFDRHGISQFHDGGAADFPVPLGRIWLSHALVQHRSSSVDLPRSQGKFEAFHLPECLRNAI